MANITKLCIKTAPAPAQLHNIRITIVWVAVRTSRNISLIFRSREEEVLLMERATSFPGDWETSDVLKHVPWPRWPRVTGECVSHEMCRCRQSWAGLSKGVSRISRWFWQYLEKATSTYSIFNSLTGMRVLAGTIIRVPRNFVDTFRADADLAKIVLVRVWWWRGWSCSREGVSSLHLQQPNTAEVATSEQAAVSTGASAVSLVGMTTTSWYPVYDTQFGPKSNGNNYRHIYKLASL